MASNYPRDRFDDVPRDKGRVGAHRADYRRSSGWVTLLWASVATVVLFGAGVFASLVVMGKISFVDGKPVTSASAPATTARIDTNYAILVLNATPDDSKTVEVTQALEQAGWASDKIHTIESDVTDFEKTTVYYPLVGDAGPALGVAGLFSAAQIEQSDAYQVGDVDASAQLTIVIGNDLAPKP